MRPWFKKAAESDTILSNEADSRDLLIGRMHAAFSREPDSEQGIAAAEELVRAFGDDDLVRKIAFKALEQLATFEKEKSPPEFIPYRAAKFALRLSGAADDHLNQKQPNAFPNPTSNFRRDMAEAWGKYMTPYKIEKTLLDEYCRLKFEMYKEQENRSSRGNSYAIMNENIRLDMKVYSLAYRTLDPSFI